MSTAKQYRLTSDVGIFNAQALLAARAASKDLKDEAVMKAIAEKSYEKFHVKGGLYENKPLGRAAGRLGRDLERLKVSNWNPLFGGTEVAATPTVPAAKVKKRTSTKAGVMV